MIHQRMLLKISTKLEPTVFTKFILTCDIHNTSKRILFSCLRVLDTVSHFMWQQLVINISNWTNLFGRLFIQSSDRLLSQQDYHGMRRCAHVVSPKPCPERKNTFLPEDFSRRIQNTLIFVSILYKRNSSVIHKQNMIRKSGLRNLDFSRSNGRENDAAVKPAMDDANN